MDPQKQIAGSSSTGSVTVASKGVSTSHVKKAETVILLDESASNSTSSENNVPDTDSTKSSQSAAEFYRLTSASRAKFAGKSPSVYEFISLYK